MRLAAIVLLLSALVGVGGCGDDDPEEPPTGARAQAIERLEDFGLPRDEAICIADALGADTVVETSEIVALTEGGEYRQAAEECIDAG